MIIMIIGSIGLYGVICTVSEALSEWVEFNAPLDTIEVISEAEETEWVQYTR